jgi:transcriptional regulator with XRE-family HTH domain
MDTIGNRIKFIRKKENLRQVDFASRVLVSASYISKVESGKEIPSDIFVKLVALEFDISYEWLKDGKGEIQISKTSYDYFERNSSFQTDKLPEEVYELNDSMEKLLQSNSTFRKMCLSEVYANILKILKLEIGDNEKDLIIEILSDYLGNLEELIERLNTIANETDYEKKSAFYISSHVKDTEKLFRNVSDLLIKP